MIPQFLGKRRNVHFSVESSALSLGLPGWEDNAKVEVPSLHEHSDQRTQVNLSYSGSDPDMFALVTNVLQQLNEPEDITDCRDTPSCTTDLGVNGVYSAFFTMQLWNPGSRANTVEPRNSGEEILKEALATETLSEKFDDLQLTISSDQPSGSQMDPGRPCCLQNCRLPSGKGSPMPHNPAGPFWFYGQIPRQESLAETPRNPSSRGLPSANGFAKYPGSEHEINGSCADQGTGPIERWANIKLVPVGPESIQLDDLRKEKMANFFEDISPSGGGRVLNFPASQPCPLPLLGPPIPANLHPENSLHASHHVSPPSLIWDIDYIGPGKILYLSLEGCYYQLRALERERKKMEADLGRTFLLEFLSSSSDFKWSQLPANPTRVDRLISAQFQESKRVRTLFEKMEQFWGVSIDKNILSTLGFHLEAIRLTQTRRKNEIINNGHLQTPGSSSYISNTNDLLALASALNVLTVCTQKTRTALWCAFQHIVLPRILSRVPGEGALDVAMSPHNPRSSQKAKKKKSWGQIRKNLQPVTK